jgi:capsular polysaccharide export protein
MKLLIFLIKNKINISKSNTFNLILNSNTVFTINSSVGLQAKICKKNVYFLGDSHFNKFTDKDINTYINSYLLDIDFFSSNDISISQLKSILHRASMV